MTSESDVGLPSAASTLVRLPTADAEMQILRALVKPTGFQYSAFPTIFKYFFIFPFSSSLIYFTFSSSSRSFTYILSDARLNIVLFSRKILFILTPSGTIIAYEVKNKHIQADHSKTE
jgi:hypothetical protein